jgi:hypothetical protein
MGASAYFSSMDGCKLTARIILLSAAGVLVFLCTMAAYCDDTGGFGHFVWWLLGETRVGSSQ